MDDIWAAIEAGDTAAVRRLLAAEPGLANARTADDVSAVRAALAAGRRSVVEALVEEGADLDVFDAAALGHSTRLEILLSIDPTLARATAPDGSSPLHLAARYGQAAAAQRLLAAGADRDQRDRAGRTAAEEAAAAGHADVVAALTGA